MNLMALKNKIIDFLSLYIWNIGFHRYEKELVKNYYKEEEKPFNKGRYIAVMVDGRQIHGGFADRIRGIATVYQFCKESNIPFRINYTSPFRLSEYLQPNKIEWRPSDREISYNRKYSQPICMQEWMLPHKWHKKYLEFRWKISRKSLHVYTNSHFHYDKFSECFQELFKPTPQLEACINYHLKNIGGYGYVAMVFRFQQLLGDFKEGNFKILDNNERETLINKCINKIKELHKTGQRILVTSDSCTFIEKVTKLDFVYTMPGKVVHVDYTNDANYETYLKSFVDFYMIANAEKIYLLKTGKMLQSGFPKTASKVYGKPFETIVF